MACSLDKSHSSPLPSSLFLSFALFMHVSLSGIARAAVTGNQSAVVSAQWQSSTTQLPVACSLLRRSEHSPHSLESYPSGYLNSTSLSIFSVNLAGVSQGSSRAEAGEGKRRGAHSSWYGDPGPHTKLCGKVSTALCMCVCV